MPDKFPESYTLKFCFQFWIFHREFNIYFILQTEVKGPYSCSIPPYDINEAVSSSPGLFYSEFHDMSPLNEAKPEVFLFSSCCLYTHRLIARLQMTVWCSCWLGSHGEGTEGGGTVITVTFLMASMHVTGRTWDWFVVLKLDSVIVQLVLSVFSTQQDPVYVCVILQRTEH